MFEYKPESTSGTLYTGADRIVIESPAGKDPSITFIESRRVNIGNEIISTPAGMIVEMLITSGPDANIAEEVELVNPLTGEALGETMLYGDIAAVVYSLYLHVAKKRDAAETPDPSA